MIFPKPGDWQTFTTEAVHQRFLRADQRRQRQTSLARIVGSAVERVVSWPHEGCLEACEFAYGRRSQVEMQWVRNIHRWRRQGGNR